MNTGVAAAVIALLALSIGWAVLARHRRAALHKAVDATSLELIAQHGELHVEYLTSLEQGERNSPLSMLYRLAESVQTPLTQLLPEGEVSLGPGRLVYCPGRDSAAESFIRAYQRRQPCPDCGLPASTIDEVLAARRHAVSPYE